MACLVDTNILLRSLQPQHPLHREAVDAVTSLLQTGEQVAIVPQVIVEFWNVCTRPAANNGLGLTPIQTETEVKRIEALLELLPETSAIYDEWRRIVVLHSVSGVEVHDARIVAAMKVHGITRILTFNEQDFKRYQDITRLTPAVAAALGGKRGE